MLLQCVCLWKVFWRTETTVESLQDEIAWAICITFSWEKILFLRHKTHGKKRRVRIFQTCCGKEDFVFKIVCLKLSAIIFFYTITVSFLMLFFSHPFQTTAPQTDLPSAGSISRTHSLCCWRTWRPLFVWVPSQRWISQWALLPQRWRNTRLCARWLSPKRKGPRGSLSLRMTEGEPTIWLFLVSFFRSLTPPQTLCHPFPPPPPILKV